MIAAAFGLLLLGRSLKTENQRLMGRERRPWTSDTIRWSARDGLQQSTSSVQYDFAATAKDRSGVTTAFHCTVVISFADRTGEWNGLEASYRRANDSTIQAGFVADLAFSQTWTEEALEIDLAFVVPAPTDFSRRSVSFPDKQDNQGVMPILASDDPQLSVQLSWDREKRVFLLENASAVNGRQNNLVKRGAQVLWTFSCKSNRIDEAPIEWTSTSQE